MSLSGLFSAQLLYPIAERRLGRDIRSKVVELEKDAALTGEARRQRKIRQLHRVLTAAGIKVPYYRELFQSIGFKPDRILDDLQYLKQLPYLDKDIVREQGRRMINEDYRMSSLHERKTGGSTGISTSIYYDQEALDWTAAVSRFAQKVTGRGLNGIEVLLTSNLGYASSLKGKLIEQVKDLAMNRVSIQTQSLSDADLQILWEKIQKVRPYLIQGHPSTLYALARYLESSGKGHESGIRAFESTGESLDQKKVALIQSQLGCKVHNRYGTAEFGVTAESTDNPFKLQIIDYIIHHETVSLGNGLEEIVGTTTTNLAMPLIRYRSGDIGQICEEDGHEFLINPQGRVHDLFEIDGQRYPTHSLKTMFDKIGGVDEFQIVEKRNGARVLNVVLKDPSKKAQIEQSIGALFQSKIPVHVVQFENLVRVGWRDKFRYIVKETP